jgi:glycogen operon protein
VSWFGPNGPVDEGENSHTLAYFLRGVNREEMIEDSDLYVMINAFWEPITFKIMVEADWQVAFNTYDENQKEDIPYTKEYFDLNPRSIVVLVAHRPVTS